MCAGLSCCLYSIVFAFSMATAIKVSSAFLQTASRRRLQPVLHRRFASSVTGTVYAADDEDAPVVRLFTKEGCTLCDNVKDVLKDVKNEFPHTLEQVDITDPEHESWFDKYKYDIPVLHLDNQFWIKHRLDAHKAQEGLLEAREGRFAARPGDPDAAAMERG